VVDVRDYAEVADVSGVLHLPIVRTRW
jgi:hypothetical protein